jgi:hypothetical protein
MTQVKNGSGSGRPAPGASPLRMLTAVALLALPGIASAQDQTVAKLAQGNVVLTDGRCDNVSFLAYMDLPAGQRLTGCWFNFAGVVNVRWLGTGESDNFPMTSFAAETAFRERWEASIAEAKSPEAPRISRDPDIFARHFQKRDRYTVSNIDLYDDRVDFDRRVHCGPEELAARWQLPGGTMDWGCWHLEGDMVKVKFLQEANPWTIPVADFEPEGREWESERYRNPMIAAFHPRNFEAARARAAVTPPIAAPAIPERPTPPLGRRIAFVSNDQAGEISLHDGRATGLCSEGYRMASSSGGPGLEASRGCWKISFGVVRVALSVPGQMTLEIPEERFTRDPAYEAGH